MVGSRICVIALVTCFSLAGVACGGSTTTIVLPHAGADVSVSFVPRGDGLDGGKDTLYVNTQETLVGGKMFVLHQVAYDGACTEQIDYTVRVLEHPDTEERREPWLRFQPADLSRYGFLPRFNDRDRSVPTPVLRELVINDLVAYDRRILSEGCPRAAMEAESRTSFTVPFDEAHCCRVLRIASDVCTRTFASAPARYGECARNVAANMHCASSCE